MIRLFRVSIPASTILLVLSDTALLIGCYVVAAFFALDASVDPWFYIRYEDGGFQIAIVVFTLQAGLYFMDAYQDPSLRTSRSLLVQQLFLLLGVSFLVQALFGYAKISAAQLPQWTMLYGSAMVLVLLPAWRISFWEIVRRTLPSKGLLFLGMSPSIQEVIATIVAKPDIGLKAIGYLDTVGTVTEVPCLGTPDELETAAQKHHVNQIIVDDSRYDLSLDQRRRLKASRTQVLSARDMYEVVFGRVSIRDMRSLRDLQLPGLGPSSRNVAIQSVYMMVLGLIGVTLTLPIMAVVWILVKLTSPGPAIYRQRRVGLYGKPFFLYKFRSMYIDAEARTGPKWATKNDPRITPVGRWLRLLRLDELPQFFNVVRGEMSVVGPRPERPEFCTMLEEKIPFYAQRHLVKPGITGWAQINHEYTETIEGAQAKLEYDLYYVKHLAPALDAYIIFHTLKVMLLLRGAQ